MKLSPKFTDDFLILHFTDNFVLVANSVTIYFYFFFTGEWILAEV